MDKKRTFLWGIIIIFLFLMLASLMPEHDTDTKKNALRLRENSIHLAVLSAETDIDCGYSKVGYEYFTPSEAVKKYIDRMNVENSERKREYKQEKPEQNMKYVSGSPTGSWQVSLEPNDDEKIIRIIGYGTDMLSFVFCGSVL